MRYLSHFLVAVLVLFLSRSGMSQWMQTSGPAGTRSFAYSGGVLLAGTENGVFRSTDSGTTWSSFGLSDGYVVALASHDSEIFAGTPLGIFRTSGSDTNWSPAGPGAAALAFSGSNIIAGTASGIFVSTDQGVNWVEAVKNGASNAIGTRGAEVVAVSGSNVYYSNDHGLTWVQKGLKPGFTYGFDFFGVEIFAGTGNNGPAIAVSHDSGATWTASNTGMPVSPFFNVHSITAVDGTMFFATSNVGIYLSTNEGMSWKSVLPDSNISAMAVGGYVYAAQLSGIWRRPIGEVVGSGSVGGSPDIGGNIRISRNPIRESTTFALTITSGGMADVRIVNLLGVEVTQIFSGVLGVGEHSWRWTKPAGMPSGLYECIIRAPGLVQSIPLVLE